VSCRDWPLKDCNLIRISKTHPGIVDFVPTLKIIVKDLIADKDVSRIESFVELFAPIEEEENVLSPIMKDFISQARESGLLKAKSEVNRAD